MSPSDSKTTGDASPLLRLLPWLLLWVLAPAPLWIWAFIALVLK